MTSCKMVCRECNEQKGLVEFYQGGNRLVRRCRSCYALSERVSVFRRKNCGIELSRCQCDDCPHDDIGQDKRLLRLRDDGLVACLGCCRYKKRRSRNLTHRQAMCDYFEGDSCIYCSRSYDNKK